MGKVVIKKLSANGHLPYFKIHPKYTSYDPKHIISIPH